MKRLRSNHPDRATGIRVDVIDTLDEAKDFLGALYMMSDALENADERSVFHRIIHATEEILADARQLLDERGSQNEAGDVYRQP